MDFKIIFTALGRRAIAAAALAVMSVELAAAAPALVVSNTNLRQGPGTGFGVIATIPGGTTVEVAGCRTGVWCSVYWQGLQGYAIARNLDLGGPAAVAPAPVYVAPAPVVVAPYPYYWRSRYYYGYRPYHRRAYWRR